MDAIAGFLEGPRARDAFLLRSMMDPPWCLRVQDEAPLTVFSIVRGTAWFMPADGEAQLLHAGDVAVIRGPGPYTVADSPSTRPQVVIHPGQRCTTPDGVSVEQSMVLGVRTWGNSSEGETVMLTGTYEGAGEVSRRLTDVLPPFIVLHPDAWDCPVVPLLADEIVKDLPGQEIVLDRLLDLLVIAVLRAWFASNEARAPSWYLAHTDPVVGRALQLIHDKPSDPWTVAHLAAEVGISRAALARRFNEVLGEPPMAYLAGWRLALAADLLREPGATVGSVARRVGYGSPFTFSAAFKRAYGASPKHHRDAGLEAERRVV